MSNTSDSIRTVLKDCVISDNVVLLPTYTIKSETYESVNQLMIELGAKKGKGRSYQFTSDPKPLLDGIINAPTELTKHLVGLLDVQLGDYVLCPGAKEDMVTALLKTKATLIAFTSTRSLSLPAHDRVLFHEGSFLSLKLRTGDFDRCLLVPPLDKERDVAYAMHALSLLRPGGALVAILAPNERRTGVRRLLAAGTGSLNDLPDGNMVLELTKA